MVPCQYCGALTWIDGKDRHELWHKKLALLIPCPACEVRAGEECFDDITGDYTHLHDARVMLR